MGCNHGLRFASVIRSLTWALIVVCLSIIPQGAGLLEENQYGDIIGASPLDETELLGDKETLDEAAKPDESTGDPGENVTVPLPETPSSGKIVIRTEIAKENSTETAPGASSDMPEFADGEISFATDSKDEDTEGAEDIKEIEKATNNAIVYVFNNDDDKLDVSLFIDSEFKSTEDISKENEVKFGSYPLETGTHKFKISWWDDDPKKSYEVERVEELDEDKAITLYTTKNTEPEEFDVTITVVNQNDKDLDAYLYIDGGYEKSKEVKKENNADFGKIDVEEGLHEFSVRWRDPDTKVEYEKRKTVRIEGDDVVVFYAPKGIVFESEVIEDKTSTTKTSASASTGTSTKSSSVSTSRASTARTSTSETSTSDASTVSNPVSKISTATTDEKDESPDEKDDNSNTIKTTRSTSTEVKDAMSETNEEVEFQEGQNSKADDVDGRLYVVVIGIIVAIYLIFFRH